MAVCPQCQRSVPEGAERCPHDGAPLGAVTSGGTMVRGSGMVPTPVPPAASAPAAGSPAPQRAPSRLDDYMSGPVEVQPGTVIGEYEVTGKLGEGGMGAVYGAVHPIIGKKVAIKILGEHLASNREVVRRFVAEARAVNQIGHRNIVDAFGFGQLADGREYYVMEYLAGRSLEDDLIERGKLSPGEIVELMGQVLDGLQAAHDKGIFHRDLKPDNIFLVSESRGYSVKILDFGIAKLSGDESALTKTRTGVAMGTPDYMSPEQCRGTRVDHRTDIYAIGCILYRLFTGELPFQGESAVELLYKHCSEEPPPPSEKGAIAPAFEAIVLRCLAKDPDARYGSASELADALEEALKAGDGVHPGAVARPSRAITPAPVPDDDDERATSVRAASPRPAPEPTAQVTPVGKKGGLPMVAIAAAAVVVIGGGVALFALGGGGDEVAAKAQTAEPAPVEQPAVAPAPADASVAAVAAEPDAGPPPPTTGALVIETNLADAVVSIDGKRVGKGKRVELPELAPGSHELTIERRRFQTVRETIEIEAGDELTRQFELERARPPRRGGGRGDRGGRGQTQDSQTKGENDRPDPLTDKDGTIDVFR